MTQPAPAAKRPHGRRPMLGRRTDEAHRAATPLELLYDLTIVVAFSISGSQAAHALAAGHVASAIVAFLFSVFAIVWAWINFTWFA
ncbi:MAG TPA: low temperature requirement protein A, partial [Phycicoccus sp.]|nr:low temperature requirement protein A [Phycicoccus sp.]